MKKLTLLLWVLFSGICFANPPGTFQPLLLSTCAGGNDANTLSLLHFDGNLTDTNLGGAAHTWTANGATALISSPVVFGTGALNNPTQATGLNSISSPYSANWEPGTGNFTIDFRLQIIATASAGTIFNNPSSATGHPGIFLNYSGTIIQLELSSGGVTNDICNACVTFTQSADGAYHYIEIVRNGTTFTMLQDGISKGTVTSSAAIFDNGSGTFNIGGLAATFASPNFDIDEFRVSNVARSFTVPTAAYCP